MKFNDVKISLARAIYDLLSKSNGSESFQISDITKRAGINIGDAFASRVLNISHEEDEVFQYDADGCWTLGKDGFDLVEVEEAAAAKFGDMVAPASDRVVRFNHNAPDAQEITKQLTEISESVRGANGRDFDEEERERVFSALKVAQEVWASGNLKLIQIKVGVLMAVEDAAALLAKTAKLVAISLLIDGIKSFVKNHFHVDLDAI